MWEQRPSAVQSSKVWQRPPPGTKTSGAPQPNVIPRSSHLATRDLGAPREGLVSLARATIARPARFFVIPRSLHLATRDLGAPREALASLARATIARPARFLTTTLPKPTAIK